MVSFDGAAPDGAGEYECDAAAPRDPYAVVGDGDSDDGCPDGFRAEEEYRLQLGASLSLTVNETAASAAFYEKLGWPAMSGSGTHRKRTTAGGPAVVRFRYAWYSVPGGATWA
ncbi:hypothetical protein SRABI83_04009 [Arthrobacter sp. Bi83]|uniref:GNAT family N-acetyltransferase n=1 Tax=Arthrobacter sp. Bi83 TaxID=2822353 RepID=UPI001DEF73AC|nr:GNAT family N-acetyltransferase [Arthrobacter sp. Bi83]CAH0284042.1 hypothetical protein SRABI83_04009 [Arthrobacter sp. Bi83]